jgi:hypothetical protein
MTQHDAEMWQRICDAFDLWASPCPSCRQQFGNLLDLGEIGLLVSECERCSAVVTSDDFWGRT